MHTEKRVTNLAEDVFTRRDLFLNDSKHRATLLSAHSRVLGNTRAGEQGIDARAQCVLLCPRVCDGCTVVILAALECWNVRAHLIDCSSGFSCACTQVACSALELLNERAQHRSSPRRSNFVVAAVWQWAKCSDSLCTTREWHRSEEVQCAAGRDRAPAQLPCSCIEDRNARCSTRAHNERSARKWRRRCVA